MSSAHPTYNYAQVLRQILVIFTIIGLTLQRTTTLMTSDAQMLNPNPHDYSLLTDLYQLTMIACYCGEGIENYPASFELFTRRLPANFGYLIAMGLAQALEYLQTFHSSTRQITEPIPLSFSLSSALENLIHQV